MEQVPKPYLFMETDHDFYFRTCGDTFKKKLYIRINRFTSKIQQLAIQQFEGATSQISAKHCETVQLIVGILTVLQQPYLCLVKQSQFVGTFMNDRIYLIKDVKFVPFKHRYLYASIDQSQCERILEEIRTEIIMDSFFFCYHVDITLTHNKFITKSKKSTQKKYFWNEDMLKIFSRHKLPIYWRVPIIQGYVSEIKAKNAFFSYTYLSVSRRNKYMSGTRYNSRGIDSQYNTANFVETQQIFKCHHYLFSHVSLRGSVPLFWDQDNIGNDIRFSKATEQQNKAVFKKYFELLISQYQGGIIAIDLLSKLKSPQKQLKNKYQYYCQNAQFPYLDFDLNSEIEKQNVQKAIENFISENKQILAGQGNMFCFDNDKQKIICQQKIIPRINCLDCVDRTNVIMARISELYMKEVQFFINAHSRDPSTKIDLGRQFYALLLDSWSKLDNRISMIYCGTQSVAGHITKKESNSLFSFFSTSVKTINRFYNASINDSSKQQCLNYFLCNKQVKSSSMQYFEDNITNEIIKNQELKYCTHQQYGAYIVTWNCNMVDPTKLTTNDLDKLLNFSRDDVDFIVICLQEMVELNSYNVILGNNQNIVQIWKNVLFKYINSENLKAHQIYSSRLVWKNKQQYFKKYGYLTGQDLVGISTFVFANEKIVNKIQNLEWLTIRTGFKGSLGNKGALILFMSIDSTPITLITCHLAAGQSNSTSRIQDIDYFHREAIKDREKRRFFDMSQFRFFVGDFNFRLQAKTEQVLQVLHQIEKQNDHISLGPHGLGRHKSGCKLSRLLQKDECLLNRNTGALSQYVQPEIHFLPTYKYIKNLKKYDVKRTPSWCDRIIFHRKDKLKLTAVQYSDIEIYLSDHKPVYGIYRFLCKKEDADKKNKLIKIYYDS